MRGRFHDRNIQIRSCHHEAAQNYCEAIQTLSWDVLIVRRALAKRLYPEASDEEVIELSDSLALVSDEEYALHQMSCSICHVHNSRSDRVVHAGELDEDCRFCKIVHKCHQHFADQQHFSNLQYSGGYYPFLRVFRSAARPGIQICFLSYQDREPQCNGVHVQLYSKGLSSIQIQEID
jgi:hypothetical protein